MEPLNKGHCGDVENCVVYLEESLIGEYTSMWQKQVRDGVFFLRSEVGPRKSADGLNLRITGCLSFQATTCVTWPIIPLLNYLT